MTLSRLCRAGTSALVMVGRIALLSGVLAWAPIHAAAFPLPDAQAPYQFVSDDMELVEALRLFGRNLSIGIELDPAIQGKLSSASGVSQTRSRQEYLEALSEEFGLVWFFDGTILHVYPASSVETRFFALQELEATRVMHILGNLGVLQPKFLHRLDARNRVLLVSGPPGYVKTIKAALDALRESERARINVIRGETSGLAIRPDFNPNPVTE